MFDVDPSNVSSSVRAILEGERDSIANCANVAAVLYHSLADVNWCGFYFMKGNGLVLGPFQGRPACIRIAPGRGVCGSAVAQREVLVVDDVRAFSGHIACDGASLSEMVIPLIKEGRVLGVLDVDSPVTARFRDLSLQEELKSVAALVVDGCDW